MSFEFVPPYAKGHITQNLAKCSFSILRCLHQFCSLFNLCYGASSQYRERKQTETRQGVLRNCSVQPSDTSCSACGQSSFWSAILRLIELGIYGSASCINFVFAEARGSQSVTNVITLHNTGILSRVIISTQLL